MPTIGVVAWSSSSSSSSCCLCLFILSSDRHRAPPSPPKNLYNIMTSILSLSSSFGLGIVAATIAPSLSVLGFFIWDNHWKGSTYALNMYKCNLGAIGFALVVVISSTVIYHHHHLSSSINNNNNNINDNKNDSSSSSSVSITTIMFQGMTKTSIGYLLLSSTIGILIGDWTWLEGLRVLGVRKVIVMDCLKPFLAAFVGKVFLKEQLTFPAYIGLALTMGGVTIIGLERDNNHNHNSNNHTTSPDGEFDEKGTNALARDDKNSNVYDDENCNNNNSSSRTDTVELDVLIDGRKASSDDCSSSASVAAAYDQSDSYATQRRKAGALSTQQLLYGTTNAILNVLLHTFGALLTKMFGSDMTTFQINWIRFGFPGLCMVLMSSILVLWDRSRSTFVGREVRQRSDATSEVVVPSPSRYRNDPWYCIPTSGAMSTSSWIHVSLGVAFVSFLCPALNNYAMFQVPLALLLTLESIGPLYSLPLAWLLQGDRPTLRAYIGVVLAVSGIVVLSFKGLNMD
jgi:drug/metabolite transporter (DMT)-like permease